MGIFNLNLTFDLTFSEQDSGSEDEEYDGGMTEIRFIPDDKGVLNLLFDALRECQTLHPDPNDSFSDGKNIK
jgi:nucleotide-sensitive chloride channel 1A